MGGAEQGRGSAVCQIMLVLLLLLLFWQRWRRGKTERIAREKQLKLFSQCSESLERLVGDVRLRQHKFNNQLDAIYSLQYVCGTYEELVNRQNAYISCVLDKNRHNALLLSKCPPVIKGFLYYKVEKAEQAGVRTEYAAAMEELECFSMEFDIIEILGILFDNAREAVEGKDSCRIRIELLQQEGSLLIAAENPSPYLTQAEIRDCLKEGYSSKGEGRGYGLNNARRIARRYKGVMLVENKDIQGQNWICVSVRLPLKG